MSTYIGIDLGGTYIKYGLVSEVGEIIGKGKLPTPAGCGYAETIEAIASAVRGLAEHGAPVCGLGIGAPGVADGEKGIIRTSGNLGWENKPLAEDLSAKLGIPVTLANDANAAAFGEYACGAGSEYKSVVLIRRCGRGAGARGHPHGRGEVRLRQARLLRGICLGSGPHQADQTRHGKGRTKYPVAVVQRGYRSGRR